jgi:hypothetical protein
MSTATEQGFTTFMNEHRDDAWGIVVARILDTLKRSESTVRTFSVEPEAVETFLQPTHQYARTGNQLLHFTFADGVSATAHAIPVTHAHPAHALYVNVIHLEQVMKDTVERIDQ